jgi:hypothetical protein
MKVDNWGLKKLFHFDNEAWIVFNDTDSIVTIKSRDGQDIAISPNHKTITNPDKNSIILPNNRVVNFSDKSQLEETDFSENFNVVIAHLLTRLREGHVIDGLDFLDYHYKWTKEKKRFLTFIKHYIISFSWVQVEHKSQFQIYANAITDWVEEKKKKRKRPFHIFVLTFPLIVYAIGWVLSPDYKEIFIGALIGGIAAPLKEVYDLVTE